MRVQRGEEIWLLSFLISAVFRDMYLGLDPSRFAPAEIYLDTI
jgi:hypothetical protein